ncbi:MAG: succinate--CoA ligase subunit alpha [Candidatus Nitrosocaldus sp.]|nr:succinate--CoA ligase subunit alpha [Candidatus Nitrosocaldus sp.]MDW8275344.1 succinate--CoA ligase subunit alpha [Candidatus Nitrosocaldus sp.]
MSTTKGGAGLQGPRQVIDIFRILQGSKSDEDYNRKPVIVQGITGKFGSLHTRLMREYGTNIVAGVTPGKGGQQFDGIPVYDSVKDAVREHRAEISVVFVPAQFFLNAAIDALTNGIRLMVAIPEHVPVRDTLRCIKLAREHNSVVVGPNTPGIIVPGVMKLGIMPAQPFSKGSTVVISRSGTLMYEISHRLTLAGFGQRLCLGIGGDPVNCLTLIECFELIRDRDDVDSVVVVGEIGGSAEEQLAEYIISTNFRKPVVAYIAGRSAPKEKRMGHAGAIVYGTYGSAESKVSMFAKADVPVAKRPAEVPILLEKKMRMRR